jgi:hypothetical protein
MGAILLAGFVHAQETETEKSPGTNSSQNENKKEERIEGRFVGRVMWVDRIDTWKGEAVPIGIDPRFRVAVDILSIEKESVCFDKKGEVILLIHSPAKLFAGFRGEPVGRKFAFKVEGVLGDGKPNYTFAQADEYRKPKTETPVKNNFWGHISPQQIAKAKEIAKDIYDGEIESIEAAQSAYSGDGVIFYFQEQIAGTYVFKRSLDIWFKKDRRKKNSVEDEAIDDSIHVSQLYVSVKRIFPLKNATLQLSLPDGLSYDQVKALLMEIESETYTVAEEPGEIVEITEAGTKRFVEYYPIFYKKIDASKISDVEFDKKTETIEVKTSYGISNGDIISFKILSNGFELVEFGFWTACFD